jgi:hypothetical protein
MTFGVLLLRPPNFTRFSSPQMVISVFDVLLLLDLYCIWMKCFENRTCAELCLRCSQKPWSTPLWTGTRTSTSILCNLVASRLCSSGYKYPLLWCLTSSSHPLPSAFQKPEWWIPMAFSLLQNPRPSHPMCLAGFAALLLLCRKDEVLQKTKMSMVMCAFFPKGYQNLWMKRDRDEHCNVEWLVR